VQDHVATRVLLTLGHEEESIPEALATTSMRKDGERAKGAAKATTAQHAG